MSAGGFGRKGTVPAMDVTARRAAFLAEERTRAQTMPRTGDGLGVELRRPALGERPFARRKTVGTAYLLWFFFGGFSGHRFYLGYTTSAVIQLILNPIGYAMVLTKSPSGLLAIVAGGIWLLADAVLLPGMVEKANERSRGLSLASTFA